MSPKAIDTPARTKLPNAPPPALRYGDPNCASDSRGTYAFDTNASAFVSTGSVDGSGLDAVTVGRESSSRSAGVRHEVDGPAVRRPVRIDVLRAGFPSESLNPPAYHVDRGQLMWSEGERCQRGRKSIGRKYQSRPIGRPRRLEIRIRVRG